MLKYTVDILQLSCRAQNKSERFDLFFRFYEDIDKIKGLICIIKLKIKAVLCRILLLEPIKKIQSIF